MNTTQQGHSVPQSHSVTAVVLFLNNENGWSKAKQNTLSTCQVFKYKLVVCGMQCNTLSVCVHFMITILWCSEHATCSRPACHHFWLALFITSFSKLLLLLLHSELHPLCHSTKCNGLFFFIKFSLLYQRSVVTLKVQCLLISINKCFVKWGNRKKLINCIRRGTWEIR
jgi:hypothetical protein